MSTHKKNLFLIVLAVITALFYFPIINFPVDPIDESFILVGADRILKGQIPHKDFSSEYPAGQYYVLDFFFKLFGISVTTERVYDILIKSLLSLCIFFIIRFLSSSRYALAGWLMSLIWIMNGPYPAYSVYPSMLFIYISVYCVLLQMKEQKNYYLVLSAVLVVISILFRHDLGGFTAIVITIVLLLRRLVRVEAWTPLVLFVVSGIVAALPVILYFVIYSDVEAVLNDLILIPMTYLKHQTLFYPSLSRWNLPYYIFPAIIVIGTIVAIILIIQKKDDTKAYALLLISIVGVFCFDRIRMRPDKAHLLPVALTGILLAPILLDILLKELFITKWQKRVSFAVFVIIFGITLSKPIEVITMILSRSNYYIVNNFSPDFERAKYQYVSGDIKNVVSFINRNTSKDDYIYVGVKNHDKFVFNDILIYFLSERNYASRYHTLNPGVQTTRKVQNEMIAEFKRNRPRLVVLGSRTWNEPNLSGIDTNVDLLDNYISDNFELKKTYGPYEIWMNKL